MKVNVFLSLFPHIIVFNSPSHQMVEFVGLSGKIEFDTQVKIFHLKTSTFNIIVLHLINDHDGDIDLEGMIMIMVIMSPRAFIVIVIMFPFITVIGPNKTITNGDDYLDDHDVDLHAGPAHQV